jgi:hypothetical protein
MSAVNREPVPSPKVASIGARRRPAATAHRGEYAFLLRCGITTVETPDGTDPAAWQKAADCFSFAYQPSLLEEPLLLGLRRTIRLGVPRNT